METTSNIKTTENLIKIKTLDKKKSKNPMDSSLELWHVETVYNATSYGGNGMLYMHIAEHYYKDGSSLPTNIPGNAPYTVAISVDNVLWKTITDIPVAASPEFSYAEPNWNLITEVPCGMISAIITDSTLPEPLDGRMFPNIYTVMSPPFATLNGDVDPGGLPTQVWFEYGIDTTYGRIAPCPEEIGHGVRTVSKKLYSKKEGADNPDEYLEPGTTYYYRCVAQNNLGIVQGENCVFMTPEYDSLPIVTTLPATEIN